MERVAKSIEENVQRLETILEKPSCSYSYAAKQAAEKVQSPSGKSVVPEKTQPVAISPIEPNGKTCEDTRKILISRFRPSDLGVQAERLRNCGKSAIQIETKNVDLNKINKEKLNRAGLKVEIQGSYRPRLVIFGVPAEVDSEGVLDSLR